MLYKLSKIQNKHTRLRASLTFTLALKIYS